jgi:alpha-glucosidase
VHLTPFFPARSNHRYDATSFDHVDPALGGDAGLAALAAALHDRGIRLLGDLTLNHTGSEHDWFRQARFDPQSPEHGFYHWLDHPDRYETWGGFPQLPKLDHRDHELRRRLYGARDSVAAKYLRPPFDLDGWRVDAANVVGRCGAVDVNRDVARALRATIADAKADAFLLAEHAHDAAPDLAGDGWHGTTAYAAATRPLWGWLRPEATPVDYLRLPLPPPRADGIEAVAAMTAARAGMPWRSAGHSVAVLGSHDTSRWRDVAGSHDVAVVGFAALVTLPFVPGIYYGDEFGLRGGSADTARGTMPWDDPGARDETLHDAVRRFVHLRRSRTALRRGGFRWVHVSADTLVFLRETREERILVHLSRAPHTPVRLATSRLGSGELDPLLPDTPRLTGGTAITLPADGPAAHLWVAAG